MVAYYRKPIEICQVNPEAGEIPHGEGALPFINRSKKKIEAFVRERKLALRTADFDDMEAVFTLQNSHYTTPNSYTPHWFYHLVNYGNCVVLEDEHKKVVGFQFEASYLDAEKTSFEAGVIVDRPLQGQMLGEKLVQYSLLMAMEKGAKGSKGIIAPDNFASIALFINKLGGTFVKFISDLGGHGPRLIYHIALTPIHLGNNRIDQAKLLDYIKTHREGFDFKLISCHDITAIEHALNNSDFTIVALIKRGGSYKEETLFALPHQKLTFG